MERRGKGRRGTKFWNKAYSGRNKDQHLTLSVNPSDDFQKFTRYLIREQGFALLNPKASVLDLGCGNGRNLIFLAREFGMRGVGYDISQEAVALAKRASAGMPLAYEVRSIAGPIPLPDASQTIVLDMMTSHFLREEERDALRKEILRVLRPGGWLFYKTFLRDEDLHAERLLKEHPANEEGSYIHPDVGVLEHVSTQEEVEETLGEHFTVHKIYKSHRHLLRGEAFKRRSVTAYAQKPLF